MARGTIRARAEELLQQRRDAHREQQDARAREVFARIPRIREIEARLDRTGMAMLRKVAEEACDPEEAVRIIMEENRAVTHEKAELLAEAGYPADYLDPSFTCTRCRDTGYEDGQLCACLQREMTDMILRESNLSRTMAQQTFARFSLDYYSGDQNALLGCSPRENMQMILSACRRFVEEFDTSEENLLFFGPSGLGKSFLSSAIAGELILRGIDVLYLSANTLFPLLEAIHFNRDSSEASLYTMRHALDCELLILDDLGAEFVTAFTASELFRVLNTRLLAHKKTIISTNLTPAKLATTYSERIVSRLNGAYSMFEFVGEDIRKKKKILGETGT